MEEENSAFDPVAAARSDFGIEPQDSDLGPPCYWPDGTPATREDMVAWAGRIIESVDLEMRLLVTSKSLTLKRAFELGSVGETAKGKSTEFPYPSEEYIAFLREEVRRANEEQEPLSDEDFEYWRRRHSLPEDDEISLDQGEEQR